MSKFITLDTLKSALAKFKSLLKKPDWNENDESADGYIANRPFYTETEPVVEKVNVITNASFKYASQGYYNINGTGACTYPQNIELTEGTLITITIETENFTGQLSASTANPDILEFVLSGQKVNGYNVPSLWSFNPEEHTLTLMGVGNTSDPAMSFSITAEMEQEREKVHKLDSKYLPEYNVKGYELDKILALVKGENKCYVLDEFGNRLYYAGTKASSSGSSASSSSSSSSSTVALPNIVFAGVVNGYYYKTVEYRLPNWALVRIGATPLCESILYTEQILTDEQKAQARDNIGAAKDNAVVYLQDSVKPTKLVQAIIENPKSIIQCLITNTGDITGGRMMFLPYYQLFRGSGSKSFLGYAIGNYDVQNSKDMLFDVYRYTATSDMGSFSVGLTPMHENKSVLDSITGIVTADKLTSPDHPTDLVAYDAFQAAVPLVQQMNISGASVGQTIKVKTVDTDGRPTSWEAADMSVDEQWELLGTLDASTGDVLQLDFSNPVKKLYFYSVLCDTAGEQYSASTTVYRQVAFKVGDTWRDVNSFKIGCCKHNWRWKTKYWLECGANLPCPKGEWTETLSAGNAVIKVTPFNIGNNNQYSSGLVSGIRFSLVLPDGTENTASGTIKVWGVKA